MKTYPSDKAVRPDQLKKSYFLIRLCQLLLVLVLLPATSFAADGWRSDDLGQPGAPGNAVEHAGFWTIKGGGAGPFFATPAWAGHFLHRTAEGDFSLTTRLHLPRGKGGRAGLMVRENMEAKGWFRFIHFDDGRIRGLARYPDGLINWGYHNSNPVADESVWLRVERRGRCVVARWSVNGMDWSLVSPSDDRWVTDSANLEVGVAVMRDEKDQGLAEAVVNQLRLEPLTLAHRTSWVGNSEGANPGWVQNHIAALSVAPNGTVYTASEWDEGSREMGIYRDGRVIGRLEGGFHDGGHHTAIACDAAQVIIAIDEGGKVGLRRYAPDGRRLDWSGGGQFRPLPEAKRAGAIALADDTLAVSDMDWHKPETAAHALRIYQLTPAGPELRQSWPVERIGRVAVAGDRTAWAIRQARVEGFRVVEPAQLLAFQVGSDQPVRRIELAGDPSALAVAPDGKLWVADNGSAQRILIYDVSGKEPRQVGFFGEENGVYGGVPGAIADRKLSPKIVGIGFDADGGTVIGADGWSWCGTDIRSFSKDGALRWRLVGLHGVVDMGGFDPGSEHDIFSGSEHFTLDWSKPGAPGWNYAGYTLDPFRFPEDARLIKGQYSRESTRVRRVQGKRLALVSDLYSEHLAVYRFDAQHGEIAIPCARLVAKGGGAPYAPQGPWLWMDANGDGRYQAAEFISLPDVRPGCGPGLDLDSAGDLWVVGSKILRLRFAGFDPRGAPTWNPTPEVTERPAVFPSGGGHELKQVLSRPEKNQLWLSGWGEGRANPVNFFASAGSLLTRFHFDAATARAEGQPTVSIPLPTDFLTGEQVTRSFDVAGDYVFTADQFDARVFIYEARSGALVHTLTPGPEVGGRSGWVDMGYGVSTIHRKNGEYAVLVEDDGFGKLMLYQWNPATAKVPASPKVRIENGALAWDPDETVGSWTVRAVGGAGTRVLVRNLRTPHFADVTLLEGARRYEVVAVNAAGLSQPSQLIELHARSAGEKLSLKPIGSDVKAAAESAKALDDDPATFSYTEDQKSWVGVSLPPSARPSRVRLLPRQGLGAWLCQGQIEACAGDPVKGPWTPLLTVESTTGDGWQEFAIADQRAWAHLRWRSANGRHNVLSEIQVMGEASTAR